MNFLNAIFYQLIRRQTTPSTHNEARRIVEQTAEPDGKAATKHVTILCHTHTHSRTSIKRVAPSRGQVWHFHCLNHASDVNITPPAKRQ